MPFYIPPISRRRFLAGGLAAGAGLCLGNEAFAFAKQEADPHAWALLSDPHIWEKKTEQAHDVNMAANLEKVRAEVLALERLPGALLVNGDCAYKDGQPGDYQVFTDLMKPFSAAGIPIHLTLGNHDHRQRFWESLKNAPAGDPPVENKHVSFVPGERANLVLLDSLDQVNQTSGLLGEKQLAWLAKTLDVHADKPAIVISHHHPQGKLIQTKGLVDTQELLDVLLPRKQAKALFFGHTHHWSVSEIEGLHCVNLPPVAYLFIPGDPNGWVNLSLADDRATVELHALDKQHPLHGDKHELKWRA